MSSHASHKETLSDAVSFAEKLFRDNPKLSVSVAARQCSNAGHHKLYRGDVAKIRQKIRAEVHRQKMLAGTAPTPVQMPTLDPNAPFISKMPVAFEEMVYGPAVPLTPEETVVSTPTQSPALPLTAPISTEATEALTRDAQRALARTDFENKERVKFDRELTHDEWRALHRDASSAKAKNAIRRRYINARLDKDPSIKPVILDADLMRLFDKGIDRDYIYECCDLAREIHGLERIHRRNTGPRQQSANTEPAPVTTPTVTQTAPVATPVPLPKPEERIITWIDPQGAVQSMRVRREHAGSIISSLQERDGVKDETIEVWGPVKRVKRERVIVDNDVE